MRKGLFLLITLILFSLPVLGAEEGFKNVTYSYGVSSIFVGIMAAIWASRTDRSTLIWFFFGWILAPLACIVALIRNAEDLKKKNGLLDKKNI